MAVKLIGFWRDCFTECKDFTQMIWRSSIEMGVCRYWNTHKNCLAIVAFYRPGGNSNAPGW